MKFTTILILTLCILIEILTGLQAYLTNAKWLGIGIWVLTIPFIGILLIKVVKDET